MSDSSDSRGWPPPSPNSHVVDSGLSAYLLGIEVKVDRDVGSQKVAANS